MGLQESRYARESPLIPSWPTCSRHPNLHADFTTRYTFTVRYYRPNRTNQKTFPHLLVTYGNGASFPTPRIQGYDGSSSSEIVHKGDVEVVFGETGGEGRLWFGGGLYLGQQCEGRIGGGGKDEYLAR